MAEGLREGDPEPQVLAGGQPLPSCATWDDLFPHVHSERQNPPTPALISGRARLGVPGCQTDASPPHHHQLASQAAAGKQQNESRMRKAQPRAAHLLLPASRCPRLSALTSPLWRPRVMRTVCLAGCGEGRGAALRSSCSQASQQPHWVPPPAHISPAPDPGDHPGSADGSTSSSLFSGSLAPALGIPTLSPHLASPPEPEGPCLQTPSGSNCHLPRKGE